MKKRQPWRTKKPMTDRQVTELLTKSVVRAKSKHLNALMRRYFPETSGE